MQFEPVIGGVRVLTDSGKVLGEARTFGQRLTSDEVLAQLGYVAVEGGGVRSMTSPERDSYLADGDVLEADQGDTDPGDPTPASTLSRSEMFALAKSRGLRVPGNASNKRLAEALA